MIGIKRLSPYGLRPNFIRCRWAGSKSVAKSDKVNYRSVEFAGRPHRGRLTDEEKTIVQENFDQVNANLKAAGIREIDLSKCEDVEKYDLYKSIIQKSPIGWRVADVSDGHLAVSHDL